MTHDSIIDQARGLQEKIAAFRRQMHRRPELSFREHATARFINDTLTAEGIECVPIAGTGVLARVEGRRKGGDKRSAVVLRADIDALPVCEATGLPFASENDGVMHACGHDMHAAALMGAMIILGSRRDEIHGTVFGLFQPGEELLPGGASMVLNENPFEGYDVRAFLGQHIEPELPTGTFGLKSGEYMASTDELYFTVHGTGGHGAMRHDLKDPVRAAATLVTELLREGNRGGERPDSVLSIGRITADGATNIVPDRVELAGTLRTFDESLRAAIKARIGEMCSVLSVVFDVRIEPDIRDGYPSVINSVQVTEQAKRALSEAFGSRAVVDLERRMTGEDFGFYTRRYPSLFYRFGAGGHVEDGAAGKLHSPVFNPDERSLTCAAAALAILAVDKLRIDN